jgi:cob(I)alamin adenosyltransferase
MSKVYTKTGDQGETGLVDGQRVSKSSLQIACYGEVDELNAIIGVLMSTLNKRFGPEMTDLEYIQNKLFDLGSLLACPEEKRDSFKLAGIKKETIAMLEKRIDEMNDVLVELKNFILPGGDISASTAHVARTVCRRVERTFVLTQSSMKNYLPENSLIFINRLSDYFFVLSRFINFELNEKEIIWEKD